MNPFGLNWLLFFFFHKLAFLNLFILNLQKFSISRTKKDRLAVLRNTTSWSYFYHRIAWLLVTEKFTLWTFQKWNTPSFSIQWWKDYIYLIFCNFVSYSNTWGKWFLLQCLVLILIVILNPLKVLYRAVQKFSSVIFV